MGDAKEAWVGIDVGGTFTDFVVLSDGVLRIFKQATTPEDQSRAIQTGLEAMDVPLAADVVHGTTVATNALLERAGSRTALITTNGFADVLEIGRQNRPYLYKLNQQRPAPLIPANLRLEVGERIDAEGKIVQPLDEAMLEDVVRRLREEEVESVAVVLLFSFLNDIHEQAIVARLQAGLPDVLVSASSRILPEYREFERTATTVVNAYVQPLVARYLRRLSGVMGTRRLRIMQSNGGAIKVEKAAEQAARLVLSGPAGGVVGAFGLASRALDDPHPHILTFDMGGTSTDVALCPGRIPRSSEGEVAGIPIRFPSTDIHTVGAGGGSLARVDAAGVLRVGPESAGAVPGPACYERGGTEPTVTDANLVLGRLDADGFLGGSGQLNAVAAHDAVRLLATPMENEMTVEAVALGILDVANSAMERALRQVSVEKGHDPRHYLLVPFGGAGSLHACALAEALDIPRVMIPLYPGVLSALGLLMADALYDVSMAVLMQTDALKNAVDDLQQKVEKLEEEVARMLEGEPVMEGMLDMRYRGQSYELEVPLTLPVSAAAIQEAEDAFHAFHAQRFGYDRVGESTEVVTLRVRGKVAGADIEIPVLTGEATPISAAIIKQKPVWFDQKGSVMTPCYDRTRLAPGHELEGPALIFQYDTTTVIPPHWRGEIDRFGNVWIEAVKSNKKL